MTSYNVLSVGSPCTSLHLHHSTFYLHLLSYNGYIPSHPIPLSTLTIHLSHLSITLLISELPYQCSPTPHSIPTSHHYIKNPNLSHQTHISSLKLYLKNSVPVSSSLTPPTAPHTTTVYQFISLIQWHLVILAELIFQYFTFSPLTSIFTFPSSPAPNKSRIRNRNITLVKR